MPSLVAIFSNALTDSHPRYLAAFRKRGMSIAPSVDLEGIRGPKRAEKHRLGGPYGYVVGASETFRKVSHRRFRKLSFWFMGFSETKEFKGHREVALLGFCLLFRVALFRRRIRETSSRATPWREERIDATAMGLRLDSALHAPERGRLPLGHLRAGATLRRDRPRRHAVHARRPNLGDHLPSRGRRRIFRYASPRPCYGQRDRARRSYGLGGHRNPPRLSLPRS